MTTKKKITPVTPINTAPAKPKTVKIRFAVSVNRLIPTEWSVYGFFDTGDLNTELVTEEGIDNALTQFVELEIPLPPETPTLRYKLEG